MNVPGDLRYSKDHEWVRSDGPVVRVGITDYAQDALGDVVFVQLPSPGDEVAASAELGEIESTKSVSEIYAPISGVVAEVNLALEDEPELVNSDPYGEGWMVAITPSEEGELEALMDSAAYTDLIEG